MPSLSKRRSMQGKGVEYYNQLKTCKIIDWDMCISMSSFHWQTSVLTCQRCLRSFWNSVAITECVHPKALQSYLHCEPSHTGISWALFFNNHIQGILIRTKLIYHYQTYLFWRIVANKAPLISWWTSVDNKTSKSKFSPAVTQRKNKTEMFYVAIPISAVGKCS